MRTRTLAILLAACGLLAAWPIGFWALGRLGWIDERWVDSLASLAFTLPIALAAAALALVAHGLRINTELYDLLELDEQFAVQELEPALAGTAPAPATAEASEAAATPNLVTVSGGTATASAAPAAAASAPRIAPGETGKMAVVERQNQGFRNKDGKTPRKRGRMGKRFANQGKYAAKSAIRRRLRDSIRMPRL